jgi:histidine triad (HIT) family protein
MPDCVFCKIVAGDLPSSQLYEDDLVLSFLDIAPLAPGHSLVIPKNHYELYPEVPADEAAALAAAMLKIAPAVVASQGAEGFNLLLCNGAPAGQVVPHVHFHIIPRKTGDDLGFRWKHGSYAEGEMESVHTAVLEQLK